VGTVATRAIREEDPTALNVCEFAKKLSEDQARTIFRGRRSEIESLLQERIEPGAFDSPGEITLGH